MSSDGAHWRLRARRRVGAVEVGDLERALWVVVTLSLVGDVVTTFAGLHVGLSESNPFARGAIDGYGLAGMLVLKGFAVGVALCCRPLLPERYAPIVPAGLAFPWTFAVIANLYAISQVV